MFVLVVGGGKVGYYLTKELIDSGHEVVLMEKDRAPGGPDRRRDRLDRHRPRRLRGQVPQRGRRQPRRHRGGRHRRRRGQPRHLPDGQAPLRRAADDRARQQPEERGAVPAPRRRRDHQPDADDPRARSSRTSPSTSCSTWRRWAWASWRSSRRTSSRARRPSAGSPLDLRCPRAARCSASSARACRRRSGPTRSSPRATR